MASNGTLTGPDENGVYSLTGLTTHSTLTIDASDPVDYTLTYVMSGDDYALYTANGGAVQSADTVQIGDETYYVLASYSGAAGSTAPIPDAPTISGRQLIWKYADGSVPNGTIDVNKFTDGGNTVYAYAYGLYQSNTAENTNTGVQYKTLTEALVDAKSGQTVRLLADTGRYYPESGTDWTWPASKTLTIDLNGHTANGSITNNGTMTITDNSVSGGGKIINGNSQTSSTIANYTYVVRNNAGATLTLSNVALEQTETVNTYNAALMNYQGTITSIENSHLSSARNYAIFNYGGQIGTIDGVTITGRYGINNRNLRGNGNTAAGGATIASYGTIGVITNVTIDVNRYGIYNGGTIDEISGTSSITATPDSAQDGDTSSAIDGNVQGYAIYNSNTWYYDTPIQKRSDDTSSGVLVRTDVYDTVNKPTIGKITGAVTVTAINTSTSVDYGVALYNAGKINEISGNAKFQTSVHPSNTGRAYSRYAIQNTGGGIIESISGNVTLSAGAYALYNGSYITEKSVTTYTTTSATTAKHTEATYIPSRIGNITGDTSGEGIAIEATLNTYGIINYSAIGDITGKVTITANKSNYCVRNMGDGASTDYVFDWSDDGTGAVRTYDYTRSISTIGTIGGGDSEILISSLNGYTLENNGNITAIRDGVTIQALTGSTSTYNNYAALLNNESGQVAYSYTRTNLGANSVTSGRYDTKDERTYTYSDTGGHIGTIKGNVKIITGGYYALSNLGTIDRIGTGVYVEAGKAYALYNSHHYVSCQAVQYYYGASAFATSTQYFTETSLEYTRALANIGVIDGATFAASSISTSDSTCSAINNGGNIGTIINSTITAKTGSRAISNAATVTLYYKNNMGDSFISYDSSTGAYKTNTVTDSIYHYDTGTIELLGGGNTITATTNAVINSGKILAIDNTDGEGNVLPNSTITASTGVGLYNYRGIGTVRTTTAGTAVTSDYVSATIGTVKNIQITGKTNAIQNGDNNGSYLNLTIDELGEGLIATAQNANGYGVYNADTNASIKLISDGDYKGGAESLTRAYAIRNPDSQTYPEGLSLTPAGKTRTVTFADGTTGSGYYYIGLSNAVAKIVDGSEFTEYASLAAAVDAYPDTGMDGSIYIQMTGNSTEPGFTIDKDVYLDLNGQTVTLNENGLTIASGVTLHGMDSTTNNYTESDGKITGTIAGDVALIYQTPTRTDGTFERYVKIQEESGLSFHRYNISVSGYRFDFNENKTSALYFQGTFSGSSTVKELLKDVGFRMDEEDVWWTNLSELSGEKYEIQIALVGDFTTDELKAPHTVYALVDFSDDKTKPTMSDPKTLSFWDALQKYYEELQAKTNRSEEENADLAILERVLTGTETAAEQETAN
ncbi:MAG: hypothetical protein Q4C45_02340 [Oscillospiraceae bacterium]|nr:hypothetical protein [Oscillospiraceae bacterium]